METIVLYPAPGMGHLISMVELGKLILSHNPSFTINILITTTPIKTGSTASYIAAISSTIPSITFHHLPTISLDPNSYPSVEVLMFDLLHLNNTHVHAALQSLSLISTVRAFIIDFFCFPALDIATALNIPTYYFITSGASDLALFLHLPTIHQNTTKSFKDMNNTNLHIPSLPPIPSSHMPEPILNRSTKAYECFLDCAVSLSKSAGIITNTFESLEPKAVKALLDGLCIPNGPTPPVFCIGPLIATNDRTGGGHECLTWLDSQPSRTVVFLCFGSMGLFSKQQLHEIALGLDRSGHRFLWVVRDPPSKDQSNIIMEEPDPDLNSLLPDGFLDRTKEKGLVVKSWAPQVAVLSHDSVGGFVTHCGWNSVLESVCAGVPMVAWPLYAEQRINKILLVEEFKLALPMNELENGLVSSAEVEKRVTELMDSEEGNSVRERAVAKRNEAMVAMSEGGSSRVALSKLVESWNRK